MTSHIVEYIEKSLLCVTYSTNIVTFLYLLKNQVLAHRCFYGIDDKLNTYNFVLNDN